MVKLLGTSDLAILPIKKSGQDGDVLPGWDVIIRFGDTVLRLLRASADTVPEETQGAEGGYLSLCQPQPASRTLPKGPYMPDQVRAVARRMKRRKGNYPISEYMSIRALTLEILKNVNLRIDVGCVG